MHKELKKAVEAELASLMSAALTVRNKQASAAITKHIKAGAKSLAKKFVKQLPKPAAKKSTKKVTKAKPKKSTAKATKPVKKANAKKKTAKAK